MRASPRSEQWVVRASGNEAACCSDRFFYLCGATKLGLAFGCPALVYSYSRCDSGQWAGAIVGSGHMHVAIDIAIAILSIAVS